MAVDDIFQLKLKGEYQAESILNVFYYRQINADIVAVNTAQQLLEGFQVNVLAPMQLVVADTFTWTEIEVVGIRDPFTYNYMDTFALPGLVPSDSTTALAAFFAWGFRFGRRAPGQRYGFKRIAGLVETQVSGRFPTAGALVSLNDLASAMGSGIASGGISFVPAVASRPIEYGVNPVSYDANGCSFRNVTTQNTRKR